MITSVYGDSSLSRTQCYEWFRRFKNGRESTEDDHRSGRPSTSTDASHVRQIDELVHSNRRLTVREMSVDCDISFGSCQNILTEHLGMRRIAAKFVPRLLTQEQKDNRRRGNEGPAFSVDGRRFSKAEESTTSSVKCQGDVDCLL